MVRCNGEHDYHDHDDYDDNEDHDHDGDNDKRGAHTVVSCIGDDHDYCVNDGESPLVMLIGVQ